MPFRKTPFIEVYSYVGVSKKPRKKGAKTVI